MNVTLRKLARRLPHPVKKMLKQWLAPARHEQANPAHAAVDEREQEKRRLYKTPRYQKMSTNLMGIPIDIMDAESFLIMHHEIIEEAIYHFHATDETPYIIDGGANIGVSVIYFKHTYPKSRVIAFEADREAFQLLSANVERGKYPDVTLVHAAIGDNEGEAMFMEEGSYAGRVARESDVHTTSVRTVRLRPYLNRKVDLLKLNIEGSETDVLMDCANLLQNVERIILEYHSFTTEAQSLHTLLTILANAGYRVYVRSVHSNWPLQPLVGVPSHMGMDLQLYVYAYRDAALRQPKPSTA